MSRGSRTLTTLSVALATLVVVAGPALGAEEGERPIVFPLDLETPYGAFGAFLIVCLLVAVALGIRNAFQQLRGDRPQSDGSWRAR